MDTIASAPGFSTDVAEPLFDRLSVGSADAVMLQTTRQLHESGIESGELRRLHRSGDYVRVRHGVYDTSTDDLTPLEAHRRLIDATMPLLGSGAVLSHASAAVLHGLAVPRGSLQRVWITRASTGGGHVGAQLHEFKAAFRDEDVVDLDGCPVTDRARTAVDLARRVGLDYGLAAADASLRAGVRREALEEQVALWPRRPWMRRARTVVDLADGGAESFGESASRLLMWQVGVPMPVLQPRFWWDGQLIRSDFGWPDLGVLGEFDGKVKYADLLRPGQSAADVLMAEKRREQFLQSQGWYVVRWGMVDLSDPQGFRRLLLSAFANASRRAA